MLSLQHVCAVVGVIKYRNVLKMSDNIIKALEKVNQLKILHSVFTAFHEIIRTNERRRKLAFCNVLTKILQKLNLSEL